MFVEQKIDETLSLYKGHLLDIMLKLRSPDSYNDILSSDITNIHAIVPDAETGEEKFYWDVRVDKVIEDSRN